MAAAAAPRINLLHLSRYPIYAQLRLEEALLRTSAASWCILNDGAAAPAIVMGISGRARARRCMRALSFFCCRRWRRCGARAIVAPHLI
jgi:hypothetical protein